MLERIQKVRANAKPPTVYRVLDFFIEKGLVHRLNKYNTYTLCQLKHEHTSNKQRIDILLVCKYCMKIVEFSDLVLAALVKKIQAEKRVIIENQEIELHCVCSGCTKISTTQVQEITDQWLDEYNNIRPHDSPRSCIAKDIC